MSFHFTKAPASTLTQSESSLALGAMTRAQRAYVPAARHAERDPVRTAALGLSVDVV